MQEDPVITEEDRIQEELVAYLDGELSADDSDRVERRLGSDPAYRQRLKQLQSAWDLLDQLPRAPVTDTFTQTTVEMVALTAQAEALNAEQRLAQRRSLGWFAVAVSVLVACSVGYIAMWRRLDRPNQQLVKDLPVIENVELYRVADSVDFLRSLDQAQLFDEEPSDAP